MCQLTVANLGSDKLNSLFLALQLPINASKNNKDGTGIFNHMFIWKDGIPAFSYGNIAKMCMDISQNQNFPLFGHVRFATAPKKIGKEQSHPFRGDKFLLAHNGTLEFSLKDDKRLKGDVDSEKFLTLLEEIQNNNPDFTFQEIIKQAIGEVTGKFAFLIVDVPEKKYYVVRGKQAELWITKTEDGFIINTDKLSLEDGIGFFSQASYVLENRYLKFSRPELLSENTVFLINGKELEKIGEVKEVPIKTYNINYYGEDDYNNSTWWKGRQSAIVPTENKKEKNYQNMVTSISNILFDKGGLTLLESDILINRILEKPITGIKEDDLVALFSSFEKLIPFMSKEKSELWKDIYYLCYDDNLLSVYKTHKLQFPYFLNSVEKITKAKEDIKIEYEKLFGPTVQ